MKTDYIHEFLVLGKCLNFSRAAEELYISQSVLSRHIAALEKELGAELLRRNTHLTELTEAGMAALESFAVISNEEKRLKDMIRQIREGETGQITFGVTDFLLDNYFENHLTTFSERCPLIQTDILSGKIREVIRDFRQGQTDVALVVTSKPEFPDAYYYPVGSIPCTCAVSEENPLSRRKMISWKDLDHETLIFPVSDEYREYIMHSLKEHGVIPGEVLQISNDDLLFHTVRARKGISLIPQPMTNTPHRRICYIPFADRKWRLHIGFVFRAGSTAPSVLKFLDSLILDETDV